MVASVKMTGRALLLAVVAVQLASGGAAAADCQWTRQPSGADWGQCVDYNGRAYCLTCPVSGSNGRICSRVPCPR